MIHNLKDNLCHKLWVRLLTRNKLSYHFIHYILRWEEISKESWQDSGDHSGFIWVAFLDPKIKRNEASMYLLFISLLTELLSSTWIQKDKDSDDEHFPRYIIIVLYSIIQIQQKTFKLYVVQWLMIREHCSARVINCIKICTTFFDNPAY